jgi:DNA (cytosine-5)-methyltransferase 1
MYDLEQELKELEEQEKITQKGGCNGKGKIKIIDNDKEKKTIILDNDNKKKEINYIDLFCGLGAFHTAFKQMTNNKFNYKCVFACDIDEDVRKLYYDNYGIKPEGDINKIDYKTIPNFDILCAGFPCQPFSIAGKKEGFDDKTKGVLFYKILEIIDIKKPNFVILENVKNLEKIDDGKTFKFIIDELEKKKYLVSYKVIDSKYYGSPQSRKRIFIICSKINKYNFRYVKLNIVPVSSIIDYSDNNFFDYDKKYRLEKNIEKQSNMIYKLINKETGKGGRQGERIYTINSYGPTICASSGGPGAKTGLYEITGKIRTLNIKETLKMFGFNENYNINSLKNKDKILFFLGNSIVVNVLKELLIDLEKIL